MTNQYFYLFLCSSILSFIFYKGFYFYFEKQVYLFAFRNFSLKKFLYHLFSITIPLILLHKTIVPQLFVIVVILLFYEWKKIYIFSNGILIGINFLKWSDFDKIIFDENELKLVKSSEILYNRVYSIKIEKDLKEHFQVLTSKSL